jgi:hypothetical protein
MRLKQILAALTILWSAVVASNPARAGSPPAGLLGRSVIVTWNETNQVRHVGDSDFRTTHPRVSLSVYISSAGRVFSRLTASKRSASGSKEEIAGEAGAVGVPTFGDRSLTIVRPGAFGALRIGIEFDAGFGSCSADVVYGKEPGHATAFKHSIIHQSDKRPVEVVSESAGDVSCSVQNGNVFGSQQQ